MSKNTNSFNPNADGQSKDNHFKDQFNNVYKEFFKEPTTMKMLSIKLKIDRANICWYCRTLRQSNKIGIAKKGMCKITKRLVNYYTTNPELFLKSNQLKMF